MTYYDWVCNECRVTWDQDHPLGEAPKQTECPECGELRNRNWGSVTTFKMIGDSQGNRARAYKYHTKGLDKDSAHEFYDTAIEYHKNNEKTGWRHYAKYTPDVDKMRAEGRIRRRSLKEENDSRERAKKMTEAVYNNTNTDIKETLERKPQ